MWTADMQNNLEHADLAALSSSEIQEISAEISHYEQQTAVAIEALKIVQKHRHWVSDAALCAIADLLNMTPEQLEAVATFYNLIYRQPVGKNVIHICNSVTCWIMGSEQLTSELCRQLQVEIGEISKDGDVTILPVVCLGACDHAPAVMLGSELLPDMTPDAVIAKLER
jgi:NADH-quinone oxidoreductase subunit E